MKKFFAVAIMLGVLLLGLGYANPDAISAEETARVKSMLEVTGVVIVKKGATKAVNKKDKDGNPVLEHVKMKSSAVINDTIVWEGETVTLKEEKIQVRLEDKCDLLDCKVIHPPVYEEKVVLKVVSPRVKKEKDEKAPSLKLLKVGKENGEYLGKILVEYGRDGLSSTFVKRLKSR